MKRFLAGHRAAEERQKRLLERRGPSPEQAVAECLDALAALEALGLWPGPRDPASERRAAEVRRRWARAKRAYRGGTTR